MRAIIAAAATCLLVYLSLGDVQQSSAQSRLPWLEIRRSPVRSSEKTWPPTRRMLKGETVTDLTKYPFMAYVTYEGEFKCGATIIHTRWVLTAGHCVIIYNRKPTISVGTVQFKTGDHLERYSVEDLWRHPNFSYITHERSEDHMEYYYYDVGLMRTARDIVLNDYVQPVKLPNTEEWVEYGNTDGTVVGYGKESRWEFKHDLEIYQGFGRVHILSQFDCEKIFLYFSHNSICTGITDPVEVCQGDSGGPLLDDNGVQIGIVSDVDDSCEWGRPDVYTRVTTILGWVRSKLAEYDDRI